MRAEFTFEPAHNVNLTVKFVNAIPVTRRRLQTRHIIDVCSDEFGVPVEDMLGPWRRRRITWARFAAWDLMRRHTTLSYPEIGRKFNRDHTTILSGVRRSKDMRNNQVYMETFERVQMRLLCTGEYGG